jgi:catechol 2,3-dioxygenase-like lactoylglutathione lyase family enzyme
MDKTRLLATFFGGVERIENAVRGISQKGLDFKSDRVDSWSIRQHLIHLVESDINNFIRIRSCIAQPSSNVYVIQEEEWVRNLGDRNESVDDYLATFRLLRKLLAAFLKDVPDEDFERRYFIRDYKGETSKIVLYDAVKNYCDHVDFHMEYIERIKSEYASSLGFGGEEREIRSTFVSTIVVVEDVIKSRTLYEGILKCTVTDDFGIYNVGFAGGLSLYKKTLFQDLTANIAIRDKSNNFVLYFETDDIDGLEKIIEKNGFEFVHRTQEQPWGQRIFRFYDFDGHIVEIAEMMNAVILKMRDAGKTIDEIAAKTGYAKERVELYLS